MVSSGAGRIHHRYEIARQRCRRECVFSICMRWSELQCKLQTADMNVGGIKAQTESHLPLPLLSTTPTGLQRAACGAHVTTSDNCRLNGRHSPPYTAIHDGKIAVYLPQCHTSPSINLVSELPGRTQKPLRVLKGMAFQKLFPRADYPTKPTMLRLSAIVP